MKNSMAGQSMCYIHALAIFLREEKDFSRVDENIFLYYMCVNHVCTYEDRAHRSSAHIYVALNIYILSPFQSIRDDVLIFKYLYL